MNPVDGEPLHKAMVAPPYFSIPPRRLRRHRGLVDSLVDRGHCITLLGAGKHATKAQAFVPTFVTPPADGVGDPVPEVVHAARVAAILEDLGVYVDVIHDHTLAAPLLARSTATPATTTGRWARPSGSSPSPAPSGAKPPTSRGWARSTARSGWRRSHTRVKRRPSRCS